MLSLTSLTHFSNLLKKKKNKNDEIASIAGNESKMHITSGLFVSFYGNAYVGIVLNAI